MLTAQGHALTSAVQAVLVQEMIETRCAGVLFSRDTAGKPDTILINATWGLGEGISQGEVDGDLYWVRRSTGELIGSEIGPATSMIVLDPDRTGTVERAVPEQQRGQPCLGVKELARLAELARSLENATGRGQDVEFGFSEQGDLMVFQVRRVMQYRNK
jgi:pyruvate,water dikinase